MYLKNNQWLFQFNGTAQCDFGHCRLDLRGGRGTARPTGRVDGKARLLVAAPGILFVPSRINTSFLRPVSFRHNWAKVLLFKELALNKMFAAEVAKSEPKIIVPRHTRVPWDSVKGSTSYHFHWYLDLFWYPTNIDIANEGWREAKRLRTTELEILQLIFVTTGSRGEDGHGGVAGLQQEDPLQLTSGPRGNTLPRQPV